MRTLRSTDYGLHWGSPTNISTVTHPPGVAYANEDTFTGPGGGVQIQSGKHAGRLVVPSIATFTNASAASCPVASACWTSATHDHALYSDDVSSNSTPLRVLHHLSLHSHDASLPAQCDLSNHTGRVELAERRALRWHRGLWQGRWRAVRR